MFSYIYIYIYIYIYMIWVNTISDESSNFNLRLNHCKPSIYISLWGSFVRCHWNRAYKTICKEDSKMTSKKDKRVWYHNNSIYKSLQKLRNHPFACTNLFSIWWVDGSICRNEKTNPAIWHAICLVDSVIGETLSGHSGLHRIYRICWFQLSDESCRLCNLESKFLL